MNIHLRKFSELTKNLTSSIKEWESEMLDMARNEDNNHGY